MTSPQNPLDDPQRMGRGATAVRFAVARYLKNSYPAMRQRALNQWRVDPKGIPTISAFSPIDVIEIATGSPPVLGVEIRNGTSLKNSEVNDYGSREYRTAYDVRINVYQLSRETEEGNEINTTSARADVIQQRDDQLAVIRACLLDRQSLGTDFLEAKPDSITINYMMPTPTNNNSGRWGAAGELIIEIIADEWNTLTAIGQVSDDVEVDVALKTDKPGFPYLGETR